MDSLRRFEGEKEEVMRKGRGRERGPVRAPCEGWGGEGEEEIRVLFPDAHIAGSPMGEPLRDW